MSMMNQIKNTLQRDFSVIPNALINDRDLSPQARFLFVYKASKPDDWNFWNSDLEKALGWSGDTLRKYEAELLESGWQTRTRSRTQRGRFTNWDYTLHASPVRKISEPVKSRIGKKPNRKNSEPYKEELTTKKDQEFSQEGEAALNANFGLTEAEAAAAQNSFEALQAAEAEAARAQNIWEAGAEDRLQAAQDAVAAALKEKPELRRTIKERARLTAITEKDFDSEITLWLTHYANNAMVMQNPVGRLTSGSGSFVLWMSKDWKRKQYNPKAAAGKETGPNGSNQLVYDESV